MKSAIQFQVLAMVLAVLSSQSFPYNTPALYTTIGEHNWERGYISAKFKNYT